MRRLAVRAAPESDASRPISPPFGSLTGSSGDSLSVLSMASHESPASALGGLVAPTAQQVFGVADWDVYREPLLGRLSDAASATETGLAARQAYETAIRNGGLHLEIAGGDAVTDLVDLLGDVRAAGVESDDEGGVVELGDLGSAVRRSLRKDEATSDAIWEEDAVDTRERFELRSSLRDAVFAESQLQDVLEPQIAEERAEQGRSESGQADFSEGSLRVRGHDEGGTIELRVASCSTAAWSQADVPQANQRTMGTDPTPGINAGSIPMDTGVGLFQAFELAVGPGEPVAQPPAGPLDQTPSRGPSARATSAAAEVDAAAEHAAVGDGRVDLPVNRALLMPFVLVAACALNAPRRRRTQDDSPGSARAQAVLTKKVPFGRA